MNYEINYTIEQLNIILGCCFFLMQLKGISTKVFSRFIYKFYDLWTCNLYSDVGNIKKQKRYSYFSFALSAKADIIVLCSSWTSLVFTSPQHLSLSLSLSFWSFKEEFNVLYCLEGKELLLDKYLFKKLPVYVKSFIDLCTCECVCVLQYQTSWMTAQTHILSFSCLNLLFQYVEVTLKLIFSSMAS